MAFVASHQQVAQVWIRPIDSLDARPLKGTGGARQVFWSPDGRFVGFFAAGGLIKKVAVTGGPPQTLVTGTASVTGATWNRDGVILFSSLASPIQRITDDSETTRRPRSRAELTPSSRLRIPFRTFSPTADASCTSSRAGLPEKNGIYLRDLDSGNERLLFNASSNVVYVPPGYLLYVRDRALMGQAFEATEGVTSGEPFAHRRRHRLLPRVRHSVVFGIQHRSPCLPQFH